MMMREHGCHNEEAEEMFTFRGSLHVKIKTSLLDSEITLRS